MRNNKKSWLHVCLILVLGLIELSLFWLIYLGLYLGLETWLYPNNPTAFPADNLRSMASVALYLLYILFLFTKTPKLLKAILSVGPNGVIIIMIVLRFYQNPFIYSGLILIFSIISVVLFLKQKAPWQFYFALGYGNL